MPINRILLAAARMRAAGWAVEWVKAHRFPLNVVAHCLLFTLSYLFSLLMLKELFLPEEARALFERSVPILVLVRLAVFWYHDLYEGVWVYVSFADLINIIRATGISTIAFALPGVFWEPLRISERLLLLDTFFCIMTVYGVRLVARTVHENLLTRSGAYLGREILLIGPLKRVQTLAGEMLSDPLSYYRPAAVVDVSEGGGRSRMRISDAPVLSVAEALSRKDRFPKVRYLVVCWPNAAQEELDRLMEDLKPMGIPFTTLPYLDELLPPEAEAPSGVPGGSGGIADSAPGGADGPAGMRKRVFLSPPHMSGLEQEYVRRAFRSNYIAPLGPMVDAFEREFSEMSGIPHALALSSGTSAIHLAMKILGIAPGDRVIASTLTFIGSVTPITFQGATPIFIDCDRTSWTMDPDLLEKALKECAEKGTLPKAVLPTDLYGQCCDYERLRRICDPYGVPLVVDAAEAMGATCRGRHAGAGTKAAVYSFNGNKIITTSGGGMLASDDRAFVEEARFLSQQAREPVPHYEHATIGYNYRMSNILAGIGLAQLKVLEERVNRRREIFDTYRRMLGDLPGIEFMPEADYGRSNRWLTVILITPEAFGANSEQVRLALGEENIESRPVWKPMHMQPVFNVKGRTAHGAAYSAEVASATKAGRPTGEAGCPAEVLGGSVAEDLFNRGLCLPSGTSMTEEDMERVIRIIRHCRGGGPRP